MPRLKNAMEVFKLLNMSNCRDCKESTCLAFAGAVFTGKRRLDECPHLEIDIIGKYSGITEKRSTIEEDMEKVVAELKGKIAALDISLAARRLEAGFLNDRLTIKILGKDFSVDSKGNFSTDIHVHPWVAIPVLSYIINGAGLPVTGKWIPFRELKSGRDWYRLFGQRCEKPLKRIADTYTDLFEDMIYVFNGRQVENHYESDISLVLHPLPKVPMLICYWNSEDGLESSLNLFFDSTAEENLNIESIYALGVGLVNMFEKFALRHGY